MKITTNLEAPHAKLRNAVLGIRALSEIVAPERKTVRSDEKKAPADAHKLLSEAFGHDAPAGEANAHARLAGALGVRR